MDIQKYEVLKKIYLNTWEHIVPMMPVQRDIARRKLDERYSADYSTWRDGEGYNHFFRLYDIDYGEFNSGLVFEMSYNTSTKYFSTFSTNSIRIAHWKPDHPRFYALYDPENANDGYIHTFIQFPCDTDYFFQRMLVQETLEYEDYELWDTEVQVMREVLKDHPALSVGMMCNDPDLHPDVVVYFAQQFFQREY
ncbi:hypothetical protein GAP32_048 [Cronobacter phage vB_CsaM_GAP32]|uniref:Uncharacterized protein n=1 Tax=Cronobacter phage vB_CsaM_GAP32 TaxID=1141136 RepID=K4F5M2_9CAUD|nr:hypothetical protein GAP32_048 [Cronobacter phage vB_CsaM_GAP32]AFC21496.1 hypothetical protein GAP32_048 [Cronobacter phage vB_CsaM_GAP32]